MRINLLLLMAVAFLPFPTRLVAEAIRDADAERTAVVFYGLSLLMISILVWALWSSAARDRTLLRPEVGEEDVQRILRAVTPGLGFYALVIALAIVAPQVAAFGYLLVAVVAVLRARGDASTPPEPA